MNLSRLIFLIGISAALACSAPVSYVVNFTLTSGAPNASGSFTFDASQATGSQFANFLVAWNTLTFDMTPFANGPLRFGSQCAAASSATFFAILSGTPACTPDTGPQWAGNTFGLGASQFLICDETNVAAGCEDSTGSIRDVTDLFGFSSASNNATGSLTITAVPEPSSLIIALACCAFLAGKRRVQGKRPAAPTNR